MLMAHLVYTNEAECFIPVPYFCKAAFREWFDVLLSERWLQTPSHLFRETKIRVLFCSSSAWLLGE